MADFKSIKNWSEDERPREKMQQRGAAALTDAELLAILISSGTAKRSALDLARDILALAKNNLQEVGKLSIADLKKVNGIGEARAITIAAALEIGRRRQMGEGLQRTSIIKSKDAAEIVMPLLNDLHHEAFCVIYLNNASKVIHHELLSKGGLTGTVVDIRIILKHALLHNANQMILAHNHPSGDLTPSVADKTLTSRIMESAATMDIRLLDHLIVGGGAFLSMSDEGII